MSNRKIKAANVRSSILILLLIAVLLIASTYAWFTSNKVVTVSTLDVHVEAANGLQISADGFNWKASLEQVDFNPNANGSTINTNYSGNNNIIPTNLNPVSTVATATSGNLIMYKGSVEGDNMLTTELSAATKTLPQDYIAFDIFLKVDADTDIVLTKESDVTMTEGSTDKGIKNSARVGFVVASDANVKPAGTAAGQIQAVEPSDVFIWEPNCNLHTSAAISHAQSSYTQTITASQVIPSYLGVKKATTIVASSNDATTFATVTPNYQTNVGNNVDTDVFKSSASDVSLKAGITKIRVYMWIEGQDYDCENNASGTNISFDLQFAVKE